MRSEAEAALRQVQAENSAMEQDLREQAQKLADLNNELEELRIIKFEELADDRADKHWQTSRVTKRSCLARFVKAMRRHLARKHLTLTVSTT